MPMDAERLAALRKDARTLIYLSDGSSGADKILRLLNDFKDLLVDYEEAMAAYETWKAFGQSADSSLKGIWHAVEPGDTAHMTYGDDPQVVLTAVLDYIKKEKTL